MSYRNQIHEKVTKPKIPSDERILKEGEKVEDALCKEKNTQKEKNLLLYVREIILFRKHQDQEGNAENPYGETQKELANKLGYTKEEITALNYWIVRSKKDSKRFLTESELDFLYERVVKKLKDPP